MNTQRKLITTIVTITTALVLSPSFADEKSVQHLNLPDITSEQEAKQVFSETIAALQKKEKLDAAELHEIHIITYSLEKAIAYFSEHIEGDEQAAAKSLAEQVELIHIASENNRAAKTKDYLKEYFHLASSFAKRL